MTAVVEGGRGRRLPAILPYPVRVEKMSEPIVPLACAASVAPKNGTNVVPVTPSPW